jgi:hypothetical protein
MRRWGEGLHPDSRSVEFVIPGWGTGVMKVGRPGAGGVSAALLN